ncbi:MAG: hypothetical protein WKF58_09140 [Ilumatobacteraceae bacterium]
MPTGASDRSGVSSSLAGICFNQYIRAGSTPSGPFVVIRTVVSSTASAPVSVAVEAVVVGLAALDEADHPVDRRHHGLGVERVTVVERDVLAQRELPRRVVDTGGKLGGETGGELALGLSSSAGSRRCCR